MEKLLQSFILPGHLKQRRQVVLIIICVKKSYKVGNLSSNLEAEWIYENAFHGAARTVTGSKHLLTLKNGKKILLDCGMFQGMGKETDASTGFWF